MFVDERWRPTEPSDGAFEMRRVILVRLHAFDWGVGDQWPHILRCQQSQGPMMASPTISRQVYAKARVRRPERKFVRWYSSLDLDSESTFLCRWLPVLPYKFVLLWMHGWCCVKVNWRWILFPDYWRLVLAAIGNVDVPSHHPPCNQPDWSVVCWKALSGREQKVQSLARRFSPDKVPWESVSHLAVVDISSGDIAVERGIYHDRWWQRNSLHHLEWPLSQWWFHEERSLVNG